MNKKAIFETNFPEFMLFNRGKVRDIYDLGDRLLMVATDRISAFDVVMNQPVPDKGKVLNTISAFWFDMMKDIIPNHVISTSMADFPEECRKYKEELSMRSMLVVKVEPIPIECVVRGYLAGSGWAEYRETGAICGIKLPAGLKEADKLPEPIFTPATKAERGEHDINISFEEAEKIVGKETAEKIRDISLLIYQKACDYAEKKGIIIADTKFEFGWRNGEIILIDELLTPDSSRFWPRKTYKPGGPQISFDKQFLRDYLMRIGWPKKPPPPHLPDEIIEKTRDKYLEALKALTGISIG